MASTFRYKFDKAAYGWFDDPEQALGPNWAKKAFEMVFNQILSTVHPQGTPGPVLRNYQRVLMALDVSEDDYLRLERAEVEFLHSSLWNDNAKVVPMYARAFVLYQDEADRVKRQKPVEASPAE